MTDLARFLSLSNPVRPLSTDDPTFDTYLPVDDAIWDEGVRHDTSHKIHLLQWH